MSHLKDLERLYRDQKSDLVLVYGRRRVGKSRLVAEFLRGKKNVYRFIGVDPFSNEENAEQARKIQIRNFLASLAEQTTKPMYKKLAFTQWEECFALLTTELPKRDIPCCIFIDELPWMACQRLDLIRALFKLWETEWSKRSKLMLIICGSSVGFLEKHFIKSSLFYGRATHHIHLHPWLLHEVKEFLRGGRDTEEIVDLYMHFGGIPRYLELVSPKDSVRKAVSRLCFSRDSFFVGEMATLFRSSFIRQSPKYHGVTSALSKHEYLGYAELAERAKSARGSSFKYILDNLLNADLVSCATPFDKIKNTNLTRYYLSDEFLRFYLQFIGPHADLIQSRAERSDLYDIILPERIRFAWQGRTFEKIIVKHAADIIRVLGLEKVTVHHGLFSSCIGKKSCQIDLVFLRSDKTITACEIKHSRNPILMTGELSGQLQKQREWLKRSYPKYRIESVLVTNAEVSSGVLRSELVDEVVRVKDLLVP